MLFNTSGLSADRTLGRTMSYSFGIQRNIGWGTIVDAAYVGTLARHLLERKNLNSIPLGTTLQPSAQDPSNPGSPLASQYLRPYPGYGDIQYYNYDANSSYHSRQVTVNRRFTKRLEGGAAWTWSKAMDYDDIDTTNLSFLVNPKMWNYGEAGFDRTHILKMHWIAAVPRGSGLLPVMPLQEGYPRWLAVIQLTSGNANNWSGSPTDVLAPQHDRQSGPTQGRANLRQESQHRGLRPTATRDLGQCAERRISRTGYQQLGCFALQELRPNRALQGAVPLRVLQCLQPHAIQRGRYEREV
jgi:hypothetical protein